ncbi:hypothetical protein GCM10027059_06560 [Myceligenerans halotolerans]
MRSLGTGSLHHEIVERLPQSLERLIGGQPETRAVVVVITPETAMALGVVEPRHGAQPDRRTRASRRAELARRRRSLGMTQEYVADEIGVQASTVGRWERGLTDPTPWSRERLCRVLGLQPAELDGLLDNACPEVVRILHVVGPRDGAGTGDDTATAIA